FGEHRMPLRDVLAAALPPLEFALLADDDDDIALLDEARGRASRLAWLIAQVERLPASDAVRALAFDSLDAYLTLQPGASRLSRTFVRGLTATPFIHSDGLFSGIDLPALLGNQLSADSQIKVGLLLITL